MNYWTKRFSHGNVFDHYITRTLLCLHTKRTLHRLGQSAQGLDDLEDILNSPAPALDSTTVDRHQSSSTVWPETASPLDRNALADSTDSDSAAAQPAQGQSVDSTASKVLEPDQLSQLRRCANTDATEPRRASVWSSAYQSASAPLTAAWTRLPEKLHNLPLFSVGICQAAELSHVFKILSLCQMHCRSWKKSLKATQRPHHNTCWILWPKTKQPLQLPQ